MTERIAHRDLRNRSAEILRNVASGECYEITNHGEVVATLSPPANLGPGLRVRPAKRRGGWSDVKPVPSEESLQEILDDLRAERG